MGKESSGNYQSVLTLYTNKLAAYGLIGTVSFLLCFILFSKPVVQYARINIYALQLVKTGFSENTRQFSAWPLVYDFEVISEKPFLILVQSHIWGALGEWDLSSMACQVYLSTQETPNIPLPIQKLCRSRELAVGGNWDDALNEFTGFLQSSGILYFSAELNRMKTSQLMTKKGSPLSKTCLLGIYSDAGQIENEECDPLFVTGRLQTSNGIGCIRLIPEILDYPGLMIVRLDEESKCQDYKQFELINYLTNSGFRYQENKKYNPRIVPYYLDDVPYQESSIVYEEDERTNLVIAPRRHDRPDILVAEKIRVEDGRQYLVGGIGRGSLKLGCIWWGGIEHGRSDMVGFEEYWSLHAMLLTPPAGAYFCVLSFYNLDYQVEANLDGLFFADMSEAVQVELSYE